MPDDEKKAVIVFDNGVRFSAQLSAEAIERKVEAEKANSLPVIKVPRLIWCSRGLIGALKVDFSSARAASQPAVVGAGSSASAPSPVPRDTARAMSKGTVEIVRRAFQYLEL